VEAAAEIRELKLACVLNLSMCYWKTNAWAQCIRACDRALQIDPQSTKALYRRAQARIIPAYCGTVENMQALEDLKRAVAIKPDDTLLTAAYAELKISLSEQKKKDKKTFNNLFERKERAASSATSSSTDTLGGSLVDEPMIPAPAVLSQRKNGNGNGSYAGASSSSSSSSAPTSSSAGKAKEEKKHLTWQDAFDMVRDMESAAERCDREGMPQQAAAMRKKKDELQKQMMIYFPKNVQSQLSEDTLEAVGAGGFSADGVCSLAGAAGARKKKGKKTKAGAKSAGAGDASAADMGGSAGLTGSAAAALSKVTTAAGGETPSSWYDVCGSTEYDLVDFSNPTPAMIKDAQSKGLDLTDVRYGGC
jgi:tetratricopeptide (TPR) repeat protein